MTATDTPYNIAIQYFDNAKNTLSKTNIIDDEYGDVKYMKTAANMIFLGVRIALDEYLKKHEKGRFVKPKNNDEYHTRVRLQGEHLSTLFHLVYTDIYLACEYHEYNSVAVMERGLENAQKIVNTIK